jgi:hypothetical protein
MTMGDSALEDPAPEDIQKGKGRVPLLMRGRARRRAAAAGDDTVSGLQLQGADDEHVAAILAAKFLKLDSAIDVLKAQLSTTTDPADHLQISTRIGEAVAERSLCKARHDAIDAGGPFNDPGQEAENALLAAMSAVDAAIATTTGISALLAAAHNLIEAFPASST